ncbi:RloB family protein [Streptosporangium subroseum]|uniref:RloB family protein n=1 Tax=Streptosporangium subroseum TaxID=106412 RepID=UPI0030869199|nr:RloB family protein [Streptosporangium subroseum]
MLIVCEGRVTEIEYFQGVRDHFRSLPVEIHDCRVIGLGRDPASVVGHAIQERDSKKHEARAQRDSNIAYDEVWCVVDVDDHTTLDRALVDARRAGINLIVSSPCFELWVLYHFQDYLVSTNGIEVGRKLKKHIPEYDKRLGSHFPFERHETAQQRAEKADPGHREPNRRGTNPSTNVWLVVETIRQAGRPT